MERFVLVTSTMPSPFPHHYETTLVRTWSSRGNLEAPTRPAIPCSPSPQFDGDETAWSAEQLLLSSLVMCLLTTFDAFAARDRLGVSAWQARVRGTLDKNARGLAFTSFTIEVDMEVDNVEQAHATLADAQRHCLIANMLKLPVEVVANIRGKLDEVRHVG
jgi:organic hydroperoxide reductase OsmC/OhrA